MWGSLPYDKYVFINMITEAGGGLEHKNSTVLMTSRWAMGTRPSYLAWLNLVSHEFFHVWNVKRLRPAALGPFDYENETYSPSLWMSEGFTSYYGDLLVRRAGIASDAEYFGNLSGDIRALETTPGRLVQPVTQSSYDAWIKQYRPDENSTNTSISYYTKGLVIAALLDARIRLATGNQKSLDDVMRLAYQRYSGARGFTEAQFRAVVTEVGGAELTDVLARALDTTQPLDYQPLLDAYGLQFAPPDSLATRGWLGITTRVDAGRLLVNQVRRDTPAAAAGLNVDDEIIAIGDYRIRADQWERRLEQYPPTTAATLLVARRDQLMKIEVTFGQEPGNAWRLAPRVAPTAAQTATRTAWLGGTP
jgi:predicted metalloprotease with PDZ domain